MRAINHLGVPAGRFRRSTLFAGALLVWALSAAAGARGAIPVAPADGARVSGTPTFAWGPGPGEDANRIEISPSPGTTDEGAFEDDPRKRSGILDDSQTSYTVPGSDPLVAGTWYWHVETLNLQIDPCCSRWTQTRRVVVEDAPIRLSSFRLGFLGGIDQLVMRIAYSDNSVDLAARFRLVFKKRRHGRRLATVSGRLSKSSFRDGKAWAYARRPKRLRRGSKYVARLVLSDVAGHVARSHYVAIRL
jgi:hypothetical protein